MIYKLNSTLTFGKYKDYDIAEVIEVDPNYLDWCLEKIDNFELDEKAAEKLDEALENFEEEDYSLYDWEEGYR